MTGPLHAVSDLLAAGLLALLVVGPAVELWRQHRDTRQVRDGQFARRHRVKGTRP